MRVFYRDYATWYLLPQSDEDSIFRLSTGTDRWPLGLLKLSVNRIDSRRMIRGQHYVWQICLLRTVEEREIRSYAVHDFCCWLSLRHMSVPLGCPKSRLNPHLHERLLWIHGCDRISKQAQVAVPSVFLSWVDAGGRNTDGSIPGVLEGRQHALTLLAPCCKQAGASASVMTIQGSTTS